MKKKSKIKKILIIIILLLLTFGVSFSVGYISTKNKAGGNAKNDQSGSRKENSETKDDVSKTKDDLTIKKEELLALLNDKIETLPSVCNEEETNCLKAEERDAKLTTYQNFIKELENVDSNEKYDELKKRIDDYLNGNTTDTNESNQDENQDPNGDNQTTTTPETNSSSSSSSSSSTTKPNSSSSSSSSTKPSSGSSSSSSSSSSTTSLEKLLNSAPLNPIKTGYPNVDNAVQKVIDSQTNSKMTTYQKVRALYDWVMNTMVYQIPVINLMDVQKIADSYQLAYNDANEIYLANDGFSTHRGSCDTYSAMFMILTRRLGLDSYTISVLSSKGSGHTTVNIKLNGKWYNFDPQADQNSKNSKGQYTYYFWGMDEAKMKKQYKAIYRDESVARFKKFAKQNVDSLKVKVTIGGKSYELVTSSRVQETKSTLIEVEYPKGGTIPVKVEASDTVSYAYEIDSRSSPYIEDSDLKNTIKSGTINVKPNIPQLGYLVMYFKSSKGKTIYLSLRVNLREKGEPYKVAKLTSASYDSDKSISFLLYTANGIGENKSYSAKVIATDDPNGIDSPKATITAGDIPSFKLTNIDYEKYYYDVEITVTDSTGQKASMVVNLKPTKS